MKNLALKFFKDQDIKDDDYTKKKVESIKQKYISYINELEDFNYEEFVMKTEIAID